MKRIILSLAAIFLALAVLSGAAAAVPDEKVAVIVGFRDLPEPALIHAHGGEVKYEYSIIPAIACRLPPAAAEALAKNPRVEYVEPDLAVHALEDLDWGVDRIEAEWVWGGTEDAKGVLSGEPAGAGVKVAVLDTGIDYNHSDLADRYIGGYDFVNEDGDPYDDNGHGTHCAGIIAASDNEEGIIGTAPEVDILAYKVLGSTGSGYYSDVILAIQRAVYDDADVISMSFGSNPKAGDPSYLEDACDYAYDAGVLLVAAAGNDGTWLARGDNVYYPARYDSVIAVAATTSSDVRAFFSGTGPAVELSAPGYFIYSTIPDGYDTMSGTSMACPHVSGTAALVKSANGELSNNAIRDILQKTALDLGKTGKDELYGYGLVQADDAVAMAGGGVSPPEPVPKELHIGDLDGSVTARGSKWQAFVTVTVHDQDCGNLAGVEITGTWDIGKTVAGTTGNDGTVSFSSGQMKTGTEITFTVTGASLEGYGYNTAANDESPIITLTRP